MKRKSMLIGLFLLIFVIVIGIAVLFSPKNKEILPYTAREKIMVNNAVKTQHIKDSLDCASRIVVKNN